MADSPPAESATTSLIRRVLLVTLGIGLAGTVAELFLLKHTDGFWQLIPVVLLGLALGVVGWVAIGRNRASIRALQLLMAIFLLSGGIGTAQHYLANARDAAESNPGLSSGEVYREAFMGVTPTLAPGTMIQLALVGLAFAFRHPYTTTRTRT